MERLRPGDTTAPSRDLRVGASGVGSLGVCWVFPTVQLTPLGRKADLTLGRGEECDVVLPGVETSRQHARLRRDGPIWILQDLGSTNGVFVDGERVSEAPLEIGSVLRVGEWVGVLESAADAKDLESPREIRPGLIAGPGLAPALASVRRAAKTELSIILEGETGTGKEHIANALHAFSARTGAFVAVNCAALPESLAEAELFGYRRGAFTGASRESAGYFRAAHSGTLFLDEVIELPLPIQAKLLRAIEQREVTPLGETRPVPVDVRLVVAAQEPLPAAVEAGRFRRDLYARLDGLTIDLPPLRQRRSDAAAIFQAVLRAQSGGSPPKLDPKLVERVCTHEWPYNVRELVQTTRRLLALHGSEPRLGLEHLPARMQHRSAPRAVPRAPAQKLATSRRERRANELFGRLASALQANKGNVSKACASVGISRQQAYRVLEKRNFDLDALRFPEDPDDRSDA